MLEDVGEHDGVRSSRQATHGFQIGDHRLIESLAQVGNAIDVVFESDRPLELVPQLLAQFAARRAQIEKRAGAIRVAADEIDENAMAASLEILERVDVRHQY